MQKYCINNIYCCKNIRWILKIKYFDTIEIGISRSLHVFFYLFLCTKCFYAWNRCATLLSPRHTVFMVMSVTQDIGTKSSGSDRNPSGSLSHCSRTCLLDWWIFMRLIRWSSPLPPRVVKRGVTSKKKGQAKGGKRAWLMKARENANANKLSGASASYVLSYNVECVSFAMHYRYLAQSESSWIWFMNLLIFWKFDSEYNFNKNFMRDKVIIML